MKPRRVCTWARRKTQGRVLRLGLLALAVYANAGVNGFALDDGYLIAENPRGSVTKKSGTFCRDLMAGGPSA